MLRKGSPSLGWSTAMVKAGESDRKARQGKTMEKKGPLIKNLLNK